MQMSFGGKAFRRKLCFGGQLLKGNARQARPIDTKLPLHLVLRSHGRASLRSPQLFNKVSAMVERTSKKYGVRIYEWANVGNHIHLLIRVTKRPLWSAFIRELTGKIARAAGKTNEKFWIYKPFTRVVPGWQKAFRSVKDYVTLNRHEAEGVIKRGDVKNLRELYAIWADTA